MKIKRRSQAFTLIELLAVLTILAIVVGIAGPAIFRQVTRGKVDAAKAVIASTEKALNTFYLDCGYFPTSEQGLQALVNRPQVGKQCQNWDAEGYLEKGKVPLDPWGNALNYASPGQKRASSFDLFSAGPDQQPGTDDDIGNWN